MDSSTEGRDPNPNLSPGANPDQGGGIRPPEDNPKKPGDSGGVGSTENLEDTVKIPPIYPDAPEHPGWIKGDE